jgi:cytoplasmic iron level regulating protein YaaA (DUF328/UPF0246 family)
VLVLLPPSEAKTVPESGAPLDLAALSFPQLTAHRVAVMGALAELCEEPEAVALDALGLGRGQAGELALDRVLSTAHAAPAAKVYTGVLFERLGLPELPRAARDRVLIASALWGVVAPDDRIPAYRLGMGASLPGLGALAAHWRPALREALPDSGLVVDLRSGAYAAAWKPREAEVVSVRAFTERKGRRSAVTHMVKATRGDVARLLLEAPESPSGPDDVAQVLAVAGHEVELTRDRGGWSLHVIEQA